jgi:hypothetical protein
MSSRPSLPDRIESLLLIKTNVAHTVCDAVVTENGRKWGHSDVLNSKGKLFRAVSDALKSNQ